MDPKFSVEHQKIASSQRARAALSRPRVTMQTLIARAEYENRELAGGAEGVPPPSRDEANPCCRARKGWKQHGNREDEGMEKAR